MHNERPDPVTYLLVLRVPVLVYIFNLNDYLELVDWTGRIIREDKLGYIKSDTPPILERLVTKNSDWLINTNQFEQVYNKRFYRQESTINTS